ncbi:alpha/beta hydrolase [Aldersonia sp. NBC_00410]|uniref:alpha/beta fold hydrolase n=1 Tax=Aldersonia sp. NBC_00410 TaxID=2975954 RepID=UPI00225AA208|nr:alpha/beta hydrolase [Aldersonia sp. NBC_00410]MCX5043708.1 alpha/beta hydrolase [Aldersonia sp. NBC_00410]
MAHDSPPLGLHVETYGKGRHTLLLIHGFSDNLSTWQRVIPELAREYRVIAVDLPGFGRASAAWPDPLIPGYVALLRELLVSQRRGPVTVIGNSLGAVTALALATEHPELVYRVVLADMPGIDGIPRYWNMIGNRNTERALRLLSLPVPAPVLQQVMEHGYSLAGMRHPRQPGSNEIRRAFGTHYADKSRTMSLLPIARQLFAELQTMPIRRMVRELTVPVLLLWGQHDILTPSNKARSFVNGPARRVVVIPDCGHCPQCDRPDEFLATVRPFVEQPFLLAG